MDLIILVYRFGHRSENKEQFISKKSHIMGMSLREGHVFKLKHSKKSKSGLSPARAHQSKTSGDVTSQYRRFSG